MKETYFMKIYKKRWKYRIMSLCFMGLAIVGLLSMGAYTYYNNTNTPTIVETYADYYDAVVNDSYVQISAEELYDLGVVKERSRRKFGVKISETKEYYMALGLDGKLLTICLPSNEYEKMNSQQSGPYLISGKFSEYTDEDLTFIKNTLIEEGSSSQEVDSFLCLNYLEYMTPFDSASVYLISPILIILLILIVFVPVMRRNTTAFKSLKKYSNGDLEKTLNQIDNEIELQDVYRNKPFTITRNYIIVETQQIVLALPLEELMWSYKYTAKGKMGKKFDSLMLVFSDKGKYKIDLNRNFQRIDDTLKYISEHSIGTFIGYSQELDDIFKKNPNEFIDKWKIQKSSKETK